MAVLLVSDWSESETESSTTGSSDDDEFEEEVRAMEASARVVAAAEEKDKVPAAGVAAAPAEERSVEKTPKEKETALRRALKDSKHRQLQMWQDCKDSKEQRRARLARRKSMAAINVAMREQRQTVHTLLSTDGMEMIHEVVLDDNIDMLKELLRDQFRIEQNLERRTSSPSPGYTPLLLAAFVGNVRMARALLAEYGANPYVRDHMGRSLHRLAILGHSTELAHLLNTMPAWRPPARRARTHHRHSFLYSLVKALYSKNRIVRTSAIKLLAELVDVDCRLCTTDQLRPKGFSDAEKEKSYHPTMVVKLEPSAGIASHRSGNLLYGAPSISLMHYHSVSHGDREFGFHQEPVQQSSHSNDHTMMQSSHANDHTVKATVSELMAETNRELFLSALRTSVENFVSEEAGDLLFIVERCLMTRYGRQCLCKEQAKFNTPKPVEKDEEDEDGEQAGDSGQGKDRKEKKTDTSKDNGTESSNGQDDEQGKGDQQEKGNAQDDDNKQVDDTEQAEGDNQKDEPKSKQANAEEQTKCLKEPTQCEEEMMGNEANKEAKDSRETGQVIDDETDTASIDDGAASEDTISPSLLGTLLLCLSDRVPWHIQEVAAKCLKLLLVSREACDNGITEDFSCNGPRIGRFLATILRTESPVVKLILLEIQKKAMEHLSEADLLTFVKSGIIAELVRTAARKYDRNTCIQIETHALINTSAVRESKKMVRILLSQGLLGSALCLCYSVLQSVRLQAPSLLWSVCDSEHEATWDALVANLCCAARPPADPQHRQEHAERKLAERKMEERQLRLLRKCSKKSTEDTNSIRQWKQELENWKKTSSRLQDCRQQTQKELLTLQEFSQQLAECQCNRNTAIRYKQEERRLRMEFQRQQVTERDIHDGCVLHQMKLQRQIDRAKAEQKKAMEVQIKVTSQLSLSSKRRQTLEALAQREEKKRTAPCAQSAKSFLENFVDIIHDPCQAELQTSILLVVMTAADGNDSKEFMIYKLLGTKLVMELLSLRSTYQQYVALKALYQLLQLGTEEFRSPIQQKGAVHTLLGFIKSFPNEKDAGLDYPEKYIELTKDGRRCNSLWAGVDDTTKWCLAGRVRVEDIEVACRRLAMLVLGKVGIAIEKKLLWPLRKMAICLASSTASKRLKTTDIILGLESLVLIKQSAAYADALASGHIEACTTKSLLTLPRRAAVKLDRSIIWPRERWFKGDQLGLAKTMYSIAALGDTLAGTEGTVAGTADALLCLVDLLRCPDTDLNVHLCVCRRIFDLLTVHPGHASALAVAGIMAPLLHMLASGSGTFTELASAPIALLVKNDSKAKRELFSACRQEPHLFTYLAVVCGDLLPANIRRAWDNVAMSGLPRPAISLVESRKSCKGRPCRPGGSAKNSLMAHSRGVTLTPLHTHRGMIGDKRERPLPAGCFQLLPVALPEIVEVQQLAIKEQRRRDRQGQGGQGGKG
ncbi:uncharacterized protein LOC135806238 isoform X2 [Sycon ciliatum]|uniref:uncharacterized protein LOC135806238 isoform X2 n=1 Tax=Sycon ciliatum TaxID=27933 RepID=UPI0031F65324